jgi:N-acetylneuraminate synthase/N,N'-diacetyllegionaminate synthase
MTSDVRFTDRFVVAAFRLVDLAAEAGADAIKFQIFRAEQMISKSSAEWRERMSTRELPYECFDDIQAHSREQGILFFATAHDLPSLEYLDGLDVPLYKIGSGEVSNWPFIKAVAARGKPVILSTGMYTIEDVEAALSAVAEAGNSQLAVLHCVTAYPTPVSEVNLRAIETIRERFGVIAGYSDHTRGYHVPLAAVARGAQVLEKHITLDFNIPNAQDWKVSCGPDDLHLMVEQIRDVERALGSGVKAPVPAEQASAEWARKSVVAAVDIAAGERISAEMLIAKRPGSGIPPSELGRLLGRRVRVPVPADTVITWGHIE